MSNSRIHSLDTVIFDVDDTLGNFTKSFDMWLAEKFGVDVPDRNQFKDYNLLAPFRDHLKEHETAISVLEDFEATGRMSDPDHLYPTSVVWLARKLILSGFNVMALTARQWMKDGQKTTSDWLHTLGIDMPVHVLGLKDSKADWINQQNAAGKLRGNIWVFEDNPHHIEDIAFRCPRVETPFVVDRPHNRSLSPTTFKRRIDPHSTNWINTWPN